MLFQKNNYNCRIFFCHPCCVVSSLFDQLMFQISDCHKSYHCYITGYTNNSLHENNIIITSKRAQNNDKGFGEPFQVFGRNIQKENQKNNSLRSRFISLFEWIFANIIHNISLIQWMLTWITIHQPFEKRIEQFVFNISTTIRFWCVDNRDQFPFPLSSIDDSRKRHSQIISKWNQNKNKFGVREVLYFIISWKTNKNQVILYSEWQLVWFPTFLFFLYPYRSLLLGLSKHWTPMWNQYNQLTSQHIEPQWNRNNMKRS